MPATLDHYDDPAADPHADPHKIRLVLHGDDLEGTKFVRVHIRGFRTIKATPVSSKKRVVEAEFDRPRVTLTPHRPAGPTPANLMGAGDINGTIDVVDNGNQPSNELPFWYKTIL